MSGAVLEYPDTCGAVEIMSDSTVAPEDVSRVNADDSALILTSGPAPRANHAFANWFQQMQFEGWEEFEAAPTPTRSDEPWRFASIRNLDLENWRASRPVSDADQASLLARSTQFSKTAGRMVFANDQLLHHDKLSEELAGKGVVWAPLSVAVSEHEELFRKHFMTQDVVLGSKKFAALHRARVSNGSFLYVPRGVEIELPLEAFHWLSGDHASVFPHTLIICEAMSKVTLVDYFGSAGNEPGFSCGVNDLFAEPGAKLNYICVQDWNRETRAFQINSTVVERDASALSLNLNLGGSYARTESVSRLLGSGGRSDMLAISVATGAQEFDQRTLQDHQQPNTTSDLLYKNSLDGTARTIFAGLIRVEPKAHQTDAYQKVRNLLLSDDAEANSMPGLEILADEVRCSHGATSGQIEEEELFYLQSRGISKTVAQQLIVFGFLNEVIARLGNETIGERLRALVQAKFDAR